MQCAKLNFYRENREKEHLIIIEFFLHVYTCTGKYLVHDDIQNNLRESSFAIFKVVENIIIIIL